MKTFDYYRVGQFNNTGPVYYMIRYLRDDGSFGSCESVTEDKLSQYLADLRAIGWQCQGRR